MHYHIKQLKKNTAVIQIQEQILHKRSDTHAVHPVTERLLLPSLLKIGQLLLGRLQGWEVVEQVAYKRQVQFGVSLDDIFGANEFAAFHLDGVRQHEFSKLRWVRLVQVGLIDSQVSWGDLESKVLNYKGISHNCAILM